LLQFVFLIIESILLIRTFTLKTMDYSVIMKSPLFRGMTPEDVISAVSSTPYRIRRFKTGSMISMSGEPVNSFMMVTEGAVKGEMVDFSGRVIKIEEIPASGALASAFIFGSRNRFPVNVVAISDTKLLTIDKVDFLKYQTGPSSCRRKSSSLISRL
jgi:CRP-like cAMP-binding protein